MATKKDKLLIENIIRLPGQIYEFLVAEATQTGINQPAVLARMIVVERIKKGNLQPLVEIAHLRPVPYYSFAPSINLRLSESYMKSINDDILTIEGGFSALVQSILIERYDKKHVKCEVEKEKLLKKRDVRLPEKIYDRLVAEAARTGIGQPSGLARMIVVERLKKDNFDPLADICRSKAEYSFRVTQPRISIRFSEANMEVINAAAAIVSNGEFSGLVQSILIERYEKTFMPSRKGRARENP